MPSIYAPTGTLKRVTGSLKIKGAFQDETDALVLARTSPFTKLDLIFVDQWIATLKACGVWAALDVLVPFWAAPNSVDSFINWANPSGTKLVIAGSGANSNPPVFTAYRGWQFTAANNSYLNTGFNPTTAVSPKFTLNNCSMWMYSLTDAAGATTSPDDCGNANAGISARGSANNAIGRANDTANDTTAVATGIGLRGWSRENDSANFKLYVGSTGANKARASTALSNATFRIGDRNGAGSDRLIPMFASGSLLTAQQVKVLEAFAGAFNVYSWGS